MYDDQIKRKEAEINQFIKSRLSEADFAHFTQLMLELWHLNHSELCSCLPSGDY